ncbi:MAG TPA: hypothetical protein VK524_14580 [Polyangiaceae bacterium]|nr:hypothetical protein [Polyangiaceae bacterium]
MTHFLATLIVPSQPNGTPGRCSLYLDTEGGHDRSTLLGFERGQLQPQPPPSNGRVPEGVGDSISAGFGDLGAEPHPNGGANPACYGTPANPSWYATYTALAGRALQAEVTPMRPPVILGAESMYAIVLIVHSWLRYVVLALGLVLLATAASNLRQQASWSERHESIHRAFLSTLDLQLLLGLLLFIVWSPLVEILLSNFAAGVKDAQLRFFGLEHPVTMLLAVVIAHVGRTRSRRKQGRARQQTVVITQALWLLLTFTAIPWPWLDVGRSLFRL